MPEITLVRHGQAKQNATSEADYDNLSEFQHLKSVQQVRGVVSGVVRRIS